MIKARSTKVNRLLFPPSWSSQISREDTGQYQEYNNARIPKIDVLSKVEDFTTFTQSWTLASRYFISSPQSNLIHVHGITANINTPILNTDSDSLDHWCSPELHMTPHWPRTLRWIILWYRNLTSHKCSYITIPKMIPPPISHSAWNLPLQILSIGKDVYSSKDPIPMSLRK